jgi:hypothetical protein
MSDPTPDPKPADAEPTAKIDFERAEYDEPDGEHVRCAACQRAITTEYWQLLGKVFCGACHEGVRGSIDVARGGAAFGKAFLASGAVALACGIGYAIFVGLTNIQLALVTIGIGWIVGRTVQRVTRGFGSVRHQVLAVALTYFASAMGYFPAVIGALGKGGDRTEQSAAAPTAAPSAAPAPTGAPAAPGRTAAGEPAAPAAAAPVERPGVGALFLFIVVTFGLTLAAPLLMITEGFSGLLGLLIIFFGLRTAWTVAKGVQASITGPHRVAART